MTAEAHLQELEAVLQDGLTTTAPAIALAIYHRGDLVFNRAYGYLDPETQTQPVQPDSRFDLASVTKLFTTTAFLQQVAEQRVGLYDPVVHIIPELNRHSPRPVEGGQDPHTLERLPSDQPGRGPVNMEQITFFHLLTHTSGLAPWRDVFLHAGPIPPPPGQPDPVSHADRMATALDLIVGYPFVDEPGSSVNYSDLGVILLGEAARRLDKANTLADVIARRITERLELSHTTFNPSDPQTCIPTEYDARWRGRRCQGEVHDETAASVGGIAGHAGLFSIAAEVAKFGQFWLGRVLDRTADCIPCDLARKATRRHAGDRGLGWLVKSPPGEYSSAGSHFSPDSFGHTGFTGTSLWIDPQRELVAALLTNRVYLGRDPEAIVAFRPKVHDAICGWIDAS